MPLNYSMVIVESDEDLLNTMSRRFIALGFDVTPVHHPRQALSAASFKPMHLAIVAHDLPEMDGIELLRCLKAQVSGLDVVLLTSDANGEQAERALMAGAYDCVPKPLRMTELERVVEEVLDMTANEHPPHSQNNHGKPTSHPFAAAEWQ